MGNMCKAEGSGSAYNKDSQEALATLLPRHHCGAVLCCDWLSSNTIVTGGDDGTVAVTDLMPPASDTATSTRVYKGHSRAINR